jgi:hypothetical protein
MVCPAFPLFIDQGDGRVTALISYYLGHLAIALEEHSFIDDQDRRHNVAVEFSRGVKLDPILSDYIPMNLPADNYGIYFYLGIHVSRFANNQRSGRLNFAGKPAIQSNYAIKKELALKFSPQADDGADFFPRLHTLLCLLPHDVSFCAFQDNDLIYLPQWGYLGKRKGLGGMSGMRAEISRWTGAIAVA